MTKRKGDFYLRILKLRALTLKNEIIIFFTTYLLHIISEIMSVITYLNHIVFVIFYYLLANLSGKLSSVDSNFQAIQKK